MGRVKDNKIISLGPDHKILIDGPAIQDNDTYGWKDNLASLSNGRNTGGTAPTWAQFTDGIYAWRFPPSATKELWLNFHINHDWAKGTDFYPHIHWAMAGSGTGVVRWGIEYTVANRDTGVFQASTTIILEPEITEDSTLRHIVTEVDDNNTIPGADVDVDAVIMMRVYREGDHANDTNAGNAFGLFLDLHYQADKFATVGKAADFNLPD